MNESAPAPSGTRRFYLQLWCVGILISAALAIFFPLRFEDTNGEMAHVAASLASGHGFSSPYGGNTGPTAHTPPVYVLLLAGIFRLWGVSTQVSLSIATFLDGCFLTGTASAVYALASRTFGYSIARWSAWICLLWGSLTFFLPGINERLPLSGYWCFDLWETALTAMLLTTIVLVTWNSTEWKTPAGFAALGLLIGITALSNPATLAAVPACLLWIAVERRRRGRPWLIPCAALLVVLLATITPWMIRNSIVFGTPTFIRSNFWLEVEMGNPPRPGNLHPNDNHTEWQRYKDLGEIAYFAEVKQRVIATYRHNPLHFAELSAKRVVYYWAGAQWDIRKFGLLPGLENLPSACSSLLALFGLAVSLRQRNRASFLFGGIILLHPLVYYFTNVSLGYRYPIDPLLLILAVVAVHSLIGIRNKTFEEMASPAKVQK